MALAADLHPREQWRDIRAGELLDAFEAFTCAMGAHHPAVGKMKSALGKLNEVEASPGSRAAREADQRVDFQNIIPATRSSAPGDHTTADVPMNGQGPTSSGDGPSRVQPGSTQTMRSEVHRERKGRKVQRRGAR